MSRSFFVAVVATGLLVGGCSGNALFADGNNTGNGGGSGGADGGNGGTSSSNGGSPSSSSNGGAPSSSSNGGAPSSSSNGGGPNTTSVGGMGGMMSSTSVSTAVSSSSGMMMCDHDICVTGGPLDPMCDPCVQQICQADPFCCQSNGNWDDLCLNQVFSVCQIDCNPNLPSCDMQYMGGTGYYPCTQTGDSCGFGLNAVQSGSCSSYCEANGGECFGAFNNQGMCGLGQQLSCNTGAFNSLICVCSRGCGTGPACGNGQTCVNGNCQ